MLILADKCENNFQCAFGHSFLRIVRKNGRASTDPVLAFGTSNFEPKSLIDKIGFSTKGLFGLPLSTDIANLGSVIVQYMQIEKREIKRIPLQMTPKNKALLIQNISEILLMPRTGKDDKAYDILFKNTPQEPCWKKILSDCQNLIIDFAKNLNVQSKS